MSRSAATFALLLLAACGAGPSGAPDTSDIGTTSHNDTIIQNYDKTFAFKSPRACSLYVFERIVDTTGFDGEYDASTNTSGSRISATYILKPKDPFPLQLDLSVGKDPPFLFLVMNQTEAKFSDAQGAVILDVKGYGGKTPTATASSPTPGVKFPSLTDAKDAITVAQCELPAQSALGFIPGFFLNKRETVVDPSTGVTAGNADAPAVVASWSGPLTILQAYEQAFTCLVATGDAKRPLGWACGASQPTAPTSAARRELGGQNGTTAVQVVRGRYNL